VKTKILLIALGALLILRTLKKPRGIRNNNPLNIRESAGGGDDWEGEQVNDTDADFEEFEAPEFGIRAAVKIIENYRKNYGLNTIAGVVGRWAPSVENDTNSYIESVSKKTGIHKNQVLSVDNYSALIKAMIIHENGSQPYTEDTILTGIKWGLA
jgi:hypothetical protein